MAPARPPGTGGPGPAGRERVAELEAELARKREEILTLRAVSARVNTTLDAAEIFDIVLSTMDELFGFHHALILLIDEAGAGLTVAAGRGYPRAALGARVPFGVGIIGTVAERRRMMRIGNLRRRRTYMATVRRELERAHRSRELVPAPELPGLKDAESQIAIPLLVGDRLVGVFSVETREPRAFDESEETLATIVANLAASAIHNAQLHAREEARRARAEQAVEARTRELERTSAELRAVREARARENRRLRFEDLAGDSPAIRAARDLLRKVARSPASTILITGENGTGKDLAARIIHDNSSRADRPFLNITCSAIADTLLESELFGHDKGAFTDARRDKPGLFELASGGTVFLDEIGEMSLLLQAKLLRFLESKTFRRVGGARDIRVDVRIVAATNRDLGRMVEDGRFREDLYYRLKVLPVELPPLRARSEDIPGLVRLFLARFQREFAKELAGISSEGLARLAAHRWPGNVRELRNALERAVLLAEGPRLEACDFPLAAGEPAAARLALLPPGGIDFEQLERSLVLQALERNDWNKARAARALRMPRDWVRYRMEKFGLAAPAGGDGGDREPGRE